MNQIKKQINKSENNLIFGIRPVVEALISGRPFDKILLKKGLHSEAIAEIQKHARTYEVPVQLVPEEALNRITRKNHQGVIGYVSPVEFTDIAQVIPSLFEQQKMPFILILDRITDVRNFGALVRTAECAGVDAVVVPFKDTARIGSDAMKTSAGALSHITLCRSKSLHSTVRYLKDSGLTIVAASEHATEVFYNVDFFVPVALIAGSEDMGIDAGLLEMADHQIKIPMMGKIESLNVSVAMGIIMFEVLKHRLSAK